MVLGPGAVLGIGLVRGCGIGLGAGLGLRFGHGQGLGLGLGLDRRVSHRNSGGYHPRPEARPARSGAEK